MIFSMEEQGEKLPKRISIPSQNGRIALLISRLLTNLVAYLMHFIKHGVDYL